MNAILLVLQSLCGLAAFDRVGITGLLPNPAGNAETLASSGRYWVAPGNKLVDIKLIAEHRGTAQWHSISVKRDKAVWNGKLFLVVGTYDCRVEIMTKNADGKLQLTRTPTVQVVME